MNFSNKIIYIISYEEWGPMLMSKHHYAIALAKHGNKVYFIGQSDKRKRLKRGEIRLVQTSYSKVTAVEHRIWHPYILKFKAKPVYNFFTFFHLLKITRKIGEQPDIVWSFDTGNSLPLSFFSKKALKIYMPVDGPFSTKFEMDAASSANIIFSVADNILDCYKSIPKQKFNLGHGVADSFIQMKTEDSSNSPLRIGYSGSLLKNDIDTSVFLQIIQQHSDKIFEFWGEYDHTKSSIHLPQDVSFSTLQFIDELKKLSHVILHGPVEMEALAAGLHSMDAFMVCYDNKDLHNNHKVLEYLASGKVVISSYMKQYEGRADFVQMVKNNKDIPILFTSVVNDLKNHNSVELQSKRIRFAAQFTYGEQIKKIASHISSSIVQ